MDKVHTLVTSSSFDSRSTRRSRILGITALLALGILESMQEQGLVDNLLKMEHNSAEYLHTLVEALRFPFLHLLHRMLADSESKTRFCR
jgi:hypothetical protein